MVCGDLNVVDFSDKDHDTEFLDKFRRVLTKLMKREFNQEDEMIFNRVYTEYDNLLSILSDKDWEVKDCLAESIELSPD